VTVACEPTGHRWRVVDQLCAERGLALACVQPLPVCGAPAGDLARVRRLGPARFGAAVRRELPRWDTARPCLRIVRAVFAALADQAGGIAHRPGALERAGLALAGWQDTHARIRQTGARMTGVLDEPGLTELVTSIAGLTAVGAAAILAETGDPNRFATPGSLARHAGLCPRDNASGGYQGKTSISVAGPACGSRRGGRSGRRCRTTRSWPLSSPT
jgi:transposase